MTAQCYVMPSAMSRAMPAWLCHGPHAAARVPQRAGVSLSLSCSLFPSADVGPRQKPASSPHGETLMGCETGTAMGCRGAEEIPPGKGDEDVDGKVTPQAPPGPSLSPCCREWEGGPRVTGLRLLFCTGQH